MSRGMFGPRAFLVLVGSGPWRRAFIADGIHLCIGTTVCKAARPVRRTRVVFEELADMDTLWMISGAVVVSIVAAVFRSRRASPTNLGYVSRAWMMRHSAD